MTKQLEALIAKIKPDLKIATDKTLTYEQAYAAMDRITDLLSLRFLSELIAELEQAQRSIAELEARLAAKLPVAAIIDVTAERLRQQSVKGFSVQQDDTYTCGELAASAICYIEPMEAENYWPVDWHDDSFKPTDYRRNLVKAGALIIAEVERIDRQQSRSKKHE